jgi:cystathionine beta-lyase/cystathionine gamma-synthase
VSGDVTWTDDTVAANGHISHGPLQHEPVAYPIYQASNFRYSDAGPYMDTLIGGPEHKEFKYSRYTNPTEREAVRVLAALEHADSGLLVSSGMAAVHLLYTTFLDRGDHVVLSTNSYYRSYSIVRKFFQRYGVELTLLGPDTDIDSVITDRTRLILVESPSNYMLRIYDLEAIAAAASRRNIVFAVDNTLASPINQTPLDFGADLVLHSASKYLGGHNDIVCGAIVGRQSLIDQLAEAKGYVGSSVDPFASYLLLRGMKTLPVRMRQINETTAAVADALDVHNRIEWHVHPHDPRHPDHELAERLLPHGTGGVLYASIVRETGVGDYATVVRFLNRLKVFIIASSFGGTESLARPANMIEFPEHPRLLRFSIGLESGTDLIRDLAQALDAN